jgi:hypothetical protein
VTVINASGVGGQATAATEALQHLGYRASPGGDDVGLGLSTTEIRYGSDAATAAGQIQSELIGGATLVASSSLGPDGLMLLTGSSYQGFTGSGASGGSGQSATVTTSSLPAPTSTTLPPSSGTTANVEPDSSSFVNGQYIPPGRVAGQAVVNCGL